MKKTIKQKLDKVLDFELEFRDKREERNRYKKLYEERKQQCKRLEVGIHHLLKEIADER